jgi:hypothetical protein
VDGLSPPKLKVVSWVKSPNSVGMVPFRFTPLRSRWRRFVFSQVEGIVPTKKGVTSKRTSSALGQATMKSKTVPWIRVFPRRIVSGLPSVSDVMRRWNVRTYTFDIHQSCACHTYCVSSCYVLNCVMVMKSEGSSPVM